jgi:phosphohistidine swiveling domain-containing protein
MYLGRLDALLRAVLAEAGRRGLTVDPSFGPRRIELPSPLGGPAPGDQTDLAPPPGADAPKNGAQGASPAGPLSVDSVAERRARQIVGQPAGPGLALGRARVIATRDDLLAFEDGEILVCDAIQPEMTFVVPLAAGIVERRGGMLIHGAIIAREYGLPCVTGVPGATELIRTGQRVTVDGYLGIVIVG